MVNRRGTREETVKKDVKEALRGAWGFARGGQTSRASVGGAAGAGPAGTDGVQVAVDFRRCAGGK